MITIMHISDLHFVNNAADFNTEEILIREAELRVKEIPVGKKLLVVTGDFHNFSDKDYNRAKNFLVRLVSVMGIDIKQDVFVVPGNHDVGNKNVLEPLLSPNDKEWSIHQDSCITMIKTTNKENYYIPERLRMFRPYTNLVRDIGIYDSTDDNDYPASTHVRCWRGKLNVLHLNTALIADGKQKDNQKTDTTTAANQNTWKSYDKGIPAIAIGHNSFYDLCKMNQLSLATTFSLYNISAYLCGDIHRREDDPTKEKIRLKSGQKIPDITIPNVVAARSIADENDDYSEVGYCWHQWDDESDVVEIEYRKWTPRYLAETRIDGEKGSYIMRHNKDEEIGDNEKKSKLIVEKKENPSPFEKDIQKEIKITFNTDVSDLQAIPAEECSDENYEETSTYDEWKTKSVVQSEDNDISATLPTGEGSKISDSKNIGTGDTGNPMISVGMLISVVSVLAVIAALVTIVNLSMKNKSIPIVPKKSSDLVLIDDSDDSSVQSTESLMEIVSGDNIVEPLSPEYMEKLINSGSKSLDYLIERIYEGCPLPIYDPIREGEAATEILYGNAIVVDAFISYGVEHYYHNYYIEKILDSIVVLLQDESIIESPGGIKSMAVAIVPLLKYESIDDKSTEYLKVAMAALDNISKNCSNQNGGYNENKVSQKRLTSDNIWLYFAFQLAYDRTKIERYLDAAKSAEEYVNSMVSQDGSYLLTGDYVIEEQNTEIVSVETQALAALILKNYIGIEKAKELMEKSGGFPKDDKVVGEVMSSECTALMSIAFRDMGKEADRASALTAVFLCQEPNGGIKEQIDFGDKSHSSLIKISSTAWYVMSCAEYDYFHNNDVD